LEAQACGTPVIACAAGGALETVTAETGVLYPGPNAAALERAVRDFDAAPDRIQAEACIANARRFGRERFRQEIMAALTETMAEFQRGGATAVRARWG